MPWSHHNTPQMDVTEENLRPTAPTPVTPGPPLAASSRFDGPVSNTDSRSTAITAIPVEQNGMELTLIPVGPTVGLVRGLVWRVVWCGVVWLVPG